MARLTIYFIKIFITILTALLAISCNIKIDGLENFEAIEPIGNIIKTDIVLTEKFENIKVSNGLKVILTQGEITKVSIEAEENLHEHIHTYIEKNTLYVEKDKKFFSKSTKNIYVTLPIINSIKASSASEIISTNSIKSKNLEITASSGANINLDLVSEKITTDASSGAEIILKGKAITLLADASSGSSIYADNLKNKDSNADASSGASIKVNTINQLDADASSGASVYYNNSIKKIVKNISSGGNVSSY